MSGRMFLHVLFRRAVDLYSTAPTVSSATVHISSPLRGEAACPGRKNTAANGLGSRARLADFCFQGLDWTLNLSQPLYKSYCMKQTRGRRKNLPKKNDYYRGKCSEMVFFKKRTEARDKTHTRSRQNSRFNEKYNITPLKSVSF